MFSNPQDLYILGVSFWFYQVRLGTRLVGMVYKLINLCVDVDGASFDLLLAHAMWVFDLNWCVERGLKG